MKNTHNNIFSFLVTTLVLLPLASIAGVTEKEVIEKLDFIRSIEVTSDKEKLNHYNSEMDKTWQYFKDNSKETLPVLKKQLELEAGKASPAHFMMLDVGYFLYLSGEPEYLKTAQKVFFKIDPQDPVVSANQQQLFEFAYRISQSKDPAILPYLDKAFLSRKDAFVFVPQHSLKLERGLINVFLYGVYGPESEQHLQELLKQNYKSNPELSRFIVELLIWIGTEKSLPQIKALMETQRDHDTFLRCVAYLMSVGGNEGKKVMLSLDTKNMDPKSSKYLDGVKDRIQKTSFEMYRSLLAGIPGEKQLEKSVVKTRLEEMYKNYGKDNQTHPLAILNADLPKEYLLEQLVKIRSRTLFRLSDEAINDVKITNALLNGLRYRDK